ncbi:pyrroline-5-carboxylate reductase [Janthinobacterium sp. HH103]|uniref:pyrroline-5-carboxylate reductase n=1 Tax=unclassified Janthinobacterium TaxID=2610881 RepID=UPI000874DDA6|nr:MULTISPECIES: pyrroline-5-carboxylate reductase [unclassified Janthinobacterium]OEZ67177.1 pyrroline-5-carboxylate reductase [Janthinobacterium sp. HH100]OEZ71693.1 pyrroline-5-carboxylate reductase [Janthinobacterium sp. HH103]QOU71701.1 Pyrroline-5-carboxylate reductase [Janthinobacterium sp. HH102]
MTTELNIAFVGGGNMAAALIAGLAGKLTLGANIHVIDPHAPALEKLQAQFGVTTATSASDALRGVDVIVLAVKPQSMRDVAAQLLPFLDGESAPLVLSIAAGIRAADLSRWLGGYGAIVRCMPNTPALIGMGITGMVASSGVSDEQKKTADAILRAVGQTVWLDDEAKIDPVTAVSGSGPAYVFYFIEAMQQAAAELGLTPEQGTQLAIATFTGAAQLAANSSEPVSLLRERVTSKGGTTYAALTSMEESGVKAAIVKGIKAAAQRGREMGDELGK